MEANNERVDLPEVEPRGKVEYQDKHGMVHFFGSEQEKADFIAQENDRDNQ